MWSATAEDAHLFVLCRSLLSDDFFKIISGPPGGWGWGGGDLSFSFISLIECDMFHIARH